jgi:hypothetical protein
MVLFSARHVVISEDKYTIFVCFELMVEYILFAGEFGDARFTEPGGDAFRENGRACHAEGRIK